jgi:bis(5'-nucleosyl)-tetraphosphatase (symmetrical)
MVHAGLAPEWRLEQAQAFAREVEEKLSGKRYVKYLTRMYGDQPDRWSNSLEGYSRFRVIINIFTRLRYCKGNGTMEFAHKENVVPRGYKPWFKQPRPAQAGLRILFGHWASLNGRTGVDNVIGLDTGCCWGRELTLMHLKSQQRITCTSKEVVRALAN